MATRQDLIDRLNVVLQHELAGVIQYMHYAVLVQGTLRPVYEEVFHDGSKEARDHAEAVGNRIVALGGVPSVEPALVRPALDLESMLRNTLELEQKALAAWEHALEIGDVVNVGTKLWIEEMVAEEQEHVDEFRKICSDIDLSAGKASGASSHSA
jgi:bacterioferritin